MNENCRNKRSSLLSAASVMKRKKFYSIGTHHQSAWLTYAFLPALSSSDLGNHYKILKVLIVVSADKLERLSVADVSRILYYT